MLMVVDLLSSMHNLSFLPESIPNCVIFQFKCCSFAVFLHHYFFIMEFNYISVCVFPLVLMFFPGFFCGKISMQHLHLIHF